MKKYAIIGFLIVIILLLSGCTQEDQSSNNEATNGEIANIFPEVSASATPTIGSSPLEVNFICVATDSDGTINSYMWDFGDGIASSEQNPTHTFESSGIYYVTITVVDNDGASNSYPITITVQEPEKITEASILKHIAFYQTPSYNPQNNGVEVCGILQNTGETNIESTVTVNFYNGNDYLVYSTEAYGSPARIAPNEKSFFQAFVFGNLDYKYYTVEFSGSESYTVDYTKYSISTQMPYTHYQAETDDLLYLMNGTIYNSGTFTAEYVNIYVVYYDGYGNLLGYGCGFIGSQGDNDFFPPQTMQSFFIVTYPHYMVNEDYSKIANYEFFASTPPGDYR